MASTTASRPDWGIVFLRIALGALLLLHGQRLIDEGVGPWTVENTAHRIAEAPDAYAWFGQNIVLRLPTLFAWLIVGGVLAAGCALFLGALVRPTCVALMFLMVNIYYAGPANRQAYVALIAICALACFIANAGARVGLDQVLIGRVPAYLTWSR